MSFEFGVDRQVKTSFKVDVEDVVRRLVELGKGIGSWTGAPDSFENTYLVYKDLAEAGIAPKGLSEDEAVKFVDELVDEVINYIEDKCRLLEYYFVEVLYGGRSDSIELYEIPGVGYALVAESYEPDSGVGMVTINFFKTRREAERAFKREVASLREDYRGAPRHRLYIDTSLLKKKRT